MATWLQRYPQGQKVVPVVISTFPPSPPPQLPFIPPTSALGRLFDCQSSYGRSPRLPICSTGFRLPHITSHVHPFCLLSLLEAYQLWRAVACCLLLQFGLSAQSKRGTVLCTLIFDELGPAAWLHSSPVIIECRYWRQTLWNHLRSTQTPSTGPHTPPEFRLWSSDLVLPLHACIAHSLAINTVISRPLKGQLFAIVPNRLLQY
jgi:hypothetical protein